MVTLEGAHCPCSYPALVAQRSSLPYLQVKHVEPGDLILPHIPALATYTLVTSTAEGLMPSACATCAVRETTANP
jgi:hypothetical protein